MTMKAILRSASVGGENVLDILNIYGMNIDRMNIVGVNIPGNDSQKFFYNKHMEMKRMNEWKNIDYTIILSIKHFTVDFSSKIKI